MNSIFYIVNTIYIMCRKYKAWLKDTLHHRSQYTTLCWTSAIALLINAIILVIAFFTINDTWYELNQSFFMYYKYSII